MIDPLFWLGLSFLLVSISLTAVLVVLVPAVKELSRAARSVEKLCDTLSRELPPTLESIRLTSLEITELTDDVTESVQSAGRVAQQVDQSVSNVRQQTQRLQAGTRSFMVGMRAAWKTFTRPAPRDRRRLSPGKAPSVNPAKSSSDLAAGGAGTHGRSRPSYQHGPSRPDAHLTPNPPLDYPPGQEPEVNFATSSAPKADSERPENGG